jgi:hypothetical protein
MSEYGFFPAAGTNYTVGQEPIIAQRLNQLAKDMHLHLVGVSGYRTPAHSVEVGGFANDPHTKGQASDTPGVENVPESTLEKYGLTRPFAGASEADHIQLLPDNKGPLRIDPNAPGAQQTIKKGLEAGRMAEEGGTDAVSGGLANPTGPSKVALDAAKAVVSLIGEWFGEEFGKAVLYVVLAGGGAALIIAGVSRAAGLHPVRTARKAAIVGAAA